MVFLRHIRVAIFALITLLMLNYKTFALEAEIREWRGENALYLSGVIELNDLRKIAHLIKAIPVRKHGARIVLLDSDGGNVGEALRISEFVDDQSVHMVVPAEAKCVSACGSILFVSGKYKTVEEGGLIGQHSCSLNGTPLAECNEVIAQHAINNGVSHGSIAAFLTYVAPHEILWFSREDVDCYGISYYPLQDISNFDKSEPCVIKALTNRDPIPQEAWRIDLVEDGYRAFTRQVADNVRELELGLFCRESTPGNLYVTLDIGGPSDVISGAIAGATISTNNFRLSQKRVKIEQVDPVFSRVEMVIPKSHVLKFLKKSKVIDVTLELKKPYDDIRVISSLATSGGMLLFAANNCVS